MRRSPVIGGSILLVVAAIIAACLGASSGYGPWNMMRGHGPGMMRGYGPGAMFRDGTSFEQGRFGTYNLGVDEVKARFDRWVAMQGNPQIKVGEVKETDDGSISVDIVTQDNSLVQRFIVDPRTGNYRPKGG